MIGVDQVIIDHLNASTLVAPPLSILTAVFTQQDGVANAQIDVSTPGRAVLAVRVGWRAEWQADTRNCTFLFLLLIVLGIITYVPALTTWLPQAVCGNGVQAAQTRLRRENATDTAAGRQELRRTLGFRPREPVA